MQDLFSLPGMPLKDELPTDGSAFGFNKVSESLDISPVHMVRYMDAAKRVLDQAIATRPEAPKPLKTRYYPAARDQFTTGLFEGDCVLLKDKKRDPSLPLPVNGRLPSERTHYYLDNTMRPSNSAVGVFRHTDADFPTGFNAFNPALAGVYKFRLSVWSFEWDKGKVLPSKKTQVIGISTRRGPVGFFDAPSIDSKVHDFEIWLEPNDILYFNCSSLEAIHVYAEKGRSSQYQGPGIAIDWLDIEGPTHDTWPPASHRLLFGDLPIRQISQPASFRGPVLPNPDRPILPPRRGGPNFPINELEHGKVEGVWSVYSCNPRADATRLLKQFLPKAFRRPVTDVQVAQYVGIVDKYLEAGDCFEEAMRRLSNGPLRPRLSFPSRAERQARRLVDCQSAVVLLLELSSRQRSG